MKHINTNYLKRFNHKKMKVCILYKYAHIHTCLHLECVAFEIYNSHQTVWGSHSFSKKLFMFEKLLKDNELIPQFIHDKK